MSMMGYLAALSLSQIAAFRARPELASDYAGGSGQDAVEQGLEARLKTLPPAEQARAREEIRSAQKALVAMLAAENPRLANQQSARDQMDRLGPFEAVLGLGKTWNILHYLFTGHADAAAAPGDSLLSGEPIGDDIGYGPPRLHDARETKAFRDFLAPLNADHLVARMDFDQMARLSIYPLVGPVDAQDAQSWRDEVAGVFSRLKAYVERAAEKGDGLLVWLS